VLKTQSKNYLIIIKAINMKIEGKILIKLLICILLSVVFESNSHSQAPEKISYQAVVRDAENNLVANSDIGMRISILQGSDDGDAVYSETQVVESNENGLVSLAIGEGVSKSNFSAINWSDGPYFIKTEFDINGGTSYTITGVSQLLSVPYAMHSKTAENIPLGSGLGDLLYWNGSNWVPIPPGKNRTALILCNGVPKWGGCDENDEPIFFVENKNNVNVFAVFSDGVVVTVDESINDGNKTARGGFAVGGYTTNKEFSQDYLIISQDSIRVYIKEEDDGSKTARGGFAVGGFTTNKEGGMENYFQVTSDTTFVSTVLLASSDLSVAGDVNIGGGIISKPYVETSTALVTESVTLNGLAISEGTEIIELGFYYGLTDNPEITGILIPGVITKAIQPIYFSSVVNLLDLMAGTTYYFRAFATNSAGVGMGGVVSFTTP
jgi:hypothetical protein